MPTLYIQYKATACAALREADIITVHGLALTYITTTCHFIDTSLNVTDERYNKLHPYISVWLS